jgi:uncharacterized lipoprotein
MKKELLRRVAAVICAGALAASISACALSEDKVAIDYIPPEAPIQVAGAAAVMLEVKGADERQQYRDRIGTKKNGYGMEMARIVASNDVVDLVRSGVEQGLKAEGFTIGGGGLTVSIELQNYYNDFRTGLATGQAVAEVAFALKVRNAAGTLVYNRFYNATNTIDGIFWATGPNAKASLEKATTQAVNQMLQDKALQDALMATVAKPTPGTRRPGS